MSDRHNRLTPEDIARMRQSAAADPAYRPRSRPQSAAAGSQHQGSRESHAQPQPPGRPSSEPAGHHQRPSNGPFKPPLEPIADDSPRNPRPPPGGFRQPPQGPSAEPPEHGDPPRHTTGGGTTSNRQNEQAHSRPPHQDSAGQCRQSRSQTAGRAFHGDIHRVPDHDNNQHKKPPPPRSEASSGYTNQTDPGKIHEHQHTKHGHGHDPHECRDQEPPPFVLILDSTQSRATNHPLISRLLPPIQRTTLQKATLSRTTPGRRLTKATDLDPLPFPLRTPCWGWGPCYHLTP